jgi:hypothetical protein
MVDCMIEIRLVSITIWSRKNNKTRRAAKGQVDGCGSSKLYLAYGHNKGYDGAYSSQKFGQDRVKEIHYNFCKLGLNIK